MVSRAQQLLQLPKDLKCFLGITFLPVECPSPDFPLSQPLSSVQRVFEQCIHTGEMSVGGAGSEAIEAKFRVRENPVLPSQLRVKKQGLIIASFSQVPLKAKIWGKPGGKKNPFSQISQEIPGDPSRSQEIPADPSRPEGKVLI